MDQRCSKWKKFSSILTIGVTQRSHIKGLNISKDRTYKENTYWKCIERKCLTTKNDQVIREVEHNLPGPNQPDLIVKMSMVGIKDTAVQSLEPPSRIINQELEVDSTGDSAG